MRQRICNGHDAHGYKWKESGLQELLAKSLFKERAAKINARNKETGAKHQGILLQGMQVQLQKGKTLSC